MYTYIWRIILKDMKNMNEFDYAWRKVTVEIFRNRILVILFISASIFIGLGRGEDDLQFSVDTNKQDVLNSSENELQHHERTYNVTDENRRDEARMLKWDEGDIEGSDFEPEFEPIPSTTTESPSITPRTSALKRIVNLFYHIPNSNVTINNYNY